MFVPDDDAIKATILSEYHDVPMGGHVGIHKVYELTSRKWYWPKMKANIIDYVRSCPQCQQNKPSHQKPIGLLQSLTVPTRRWQQVTMDLITQLPKSGEGNDAVVVFVDKLSKMVHYVATRTDVDAVGLSRLFVSNVVRLHGVPDSIVSDRDTRFTSNFWKSLWKQIGTKLQMSTAFHPQSDGQTERANRTLEEALRAYVNLNHDDWDRQLPLLEFAVNNAKSSSTEQSPFSLNYGEHPRMPIDIIVGDSNVEEVHQVLERMQNNLRIATENVRKSQEVQAKNANRKRRDFVFEVGENVLLSTKNISFVSKGPANKLNPKFIGPFKIIERIGEVAYKLELPHEMLRNRIHPVFHASLLKRHITSEHFGEREPLKPPPAEMTDEAELKWEVEKLLRIRMHRGNTQYLVAWKGYPLHEATWEPEWRILEDAPESVAEFNKDNTIEHPKPLRRSQRSRRKPRW